MVNFTKTVAYGQAGDAPAFEPWIGAKYRSIRNAGDASCCTPLWHIMGESHYSEDKEPRRSLTIEAMEQLALTGYKFFDKLMMVTSGKSIAEVDRAKDWQNFAFSNFIQDVLDPGARPTDAQWKHGTESFFAQLAITRPRLLLVVGKQQWDHLPETGGMRLPPIPFSDNSGYVEDAWLYGYKVGQTPYFTIASWIYHPAAYNKLDVNAANKRYHALSMHCCNVLSGISGNPTGDTFSYDY